MQLYTGQQKKETLKNINDNIRRLIDSLQYSTSSGDYSGIERDRKELNKLKIVLNILEMD